MNSSWHTSMQVIITLNAAVNGRYNIEDTYSIVQHQHALTISSSSASSNFEYKTIVKSNTIVVECLNVSDNSQQRHGKG